MPKNSLCKDHCCKLSAIIGICGAGEFLHEKMESGTDFVFPHTPCYQFCDPTVATAFNAHIHVLQMVDSVLHMSSMNAHSVKDFYIALGDASKE